MIEAEYIDITNLAKLRGVIALLVDYHPSRKFATEVENIYAEIRRLEVKLDGIANE